MSILNGFSKVKRYRKTESGYKLQSQWTSSETVEMSDGSILQDQLAALSGSLNGLSLIVCTQAEYDALSADDKSSQTLYFITEE